MASSFQSVEMFHLQGPSFSQGRQEHFIDSENPSEKTYIDKRNQDTSGNKRVTGLEAIFKTHKSCKNSVKQV